jgi:hypothetical protein
LDCFVETPPESGIALIFPMAAGLGLNLRPGRTTEPLIDGQVIAIVVCWSTLSIAVTSTRIDSPIMIVERGLARVDVSSSLRRIQRLGAAIFPSLAHQYFEIASNGGACLTVT